jgi:outer membrane autotransporter protein
MFTLYSGWRLQNFFFTPQANAGLASFTGHRIVTVGSLSRIADGDWNAYVASGGFSTGYVMNFGAIQIIPQISIDGLYLYQSGYSETGGGDGINLNVSKQDMRSVRLFAGVVAQGAFALEEGRLQPQILAGWSHEFESDAPVIDASFQALPGSPFALVGPTSDPSKLIGGASFSYIFNNWTAGLNYDATRDSGSLAQSATVMLTSKF